MTKSKIEVYFYNDSALIEIYLRVILFLNKAKLIKLSKNKKKVIFEFEAENGKKFKIIKSFFSFYNFFEVKKLVTNY